MAEKIKRFLVDVVLENVCRLVYHTYRFLNGRFYNHRVLHQPYKCIWSIVMWTLFIYLFTTQVMFRIIEWWDPIVYKMNYVIWG